MLVKYLEDLSSMYLLNRAYFIDVYTKWSQSNEIASIESPMAKNKRMLQLALEPILHEDWTVCLDPKFGDVNQIPPFLFRPSCYQRYIDDFSVTLFAYYRDNVQAVTELVQNDPAYSNNKNIENVVNTFQEFCSVTVNAICRHDA